MGDHHRVQRPIELLLPESQEVMEDREIRAEIVILPDVGLQQPAMIGTPVVDVRRREPVSTDLTLKVFRDHGCSPVRRTYQCHVATRRFQAANMNKMFTISALAASPR